MDSPGSARRLCLFTPCSRYKVKRGSASDFENLPGRAQCGFLAPAPAYLGAASEVSQLDQVASTRCPPASRKPRLFFVGTDLVLVEDPIVCTEHATGVAVPSTRGSIWLTSDKSTEDRAASDGASTPPDA